MQRLNGPLINQIFQSEKLKFITCSQSKCGGNKLISGKNDKDNVFEKNCLSFEDFNPLRSKNFFGRSEFSSDFKVELSMKTSVIYREDSRISAVTLY